MDVRNGARGVPHRCAAVRPGRLSLIWLMVFLGAMGAGCGARVAAGTTSSNPPRSRASAHPAEPQSTAAAAAVMTSPDKIESLGRGKYKDIYGGVYVHDHGAASSLEVYLVKLTSSAEADFATAAAPLPIVFRKASLSQESLNALEDRLTDANPLLCKEGVRLAASGTHMQTGRLHVDVVHLKEGDREKIAAVIHSDRFDLSNSLGLANGASSLSHPVKLSVRC